MDAKEINDGKIWAVLGYFIGVVAIVMLIVRTNAYAVYHAKQWLILAITALAIWIPLFISFLVLGAVFPKSAGCLILPVYGLVMVSIIVLVVMGVINAASGVCKPLPVIGVFAEQWFKGIQKKPVI
jgi:uncharacterized membrane protein